MQPVDRAWETGLRRHYRHRLPLSGHGSPCRRYHAERRHGQSERSLREWRESDPVSQTSANLLIATLTTTFTARAYPSVNRIAIRHQYLIWIRPQFCTNRCCTPSGISPQATTIFLWTSMPQQRAYTISIGYLHGERPTWVLGDVDSPLRALC